MVAVIMLGKVIIMNREKMTQCMRDGCTYQQVHQINNYIDKLQQENKQLKELIDTILNWNIFKNECPMNFGYDEETNEDKAQDVFYKDDDYCENN